MTETEWLTRRDHGDGITELQLGHAPDNRLTVDFLQDLEHQIRDMTADPEVRSILITSPFADFSAGLVEGTGGDAALRSQLTTTFLALYACPKPTVVATVGLSSGAGMFFVLCSDVRVAHARSSFEMTEVLLGQALPPALMEIARGSLDTNTQRRLMMTGQRLGPIAARNAQFIEILADDLEDLHGYALKEARKLAALPQATYAQIKQGLRGAVIARIERQLDTALQAEHDAHDEATAVTSSAKAG